MATARSPVPSGRRSDPACQHPPANRLSTAMAGALRARWGRGGSALGVACAHCSNPRQRSRPMLSDLELMELNVAALYRHDARGRMLAENEPGDFPAPRLYVGLTSGGNLWRFRHDLPDSLVR